MIIENIEYYPYRVPLKAEFKIATDTMNYAEGVLVRIKTSEFMGYGEAAPSAIILGETQSSVIAALELFKKHIIGKDTADIENIIDSMDRVLYGNNAAKAAVDIALHDIIAKEAGFSVKKLLGGAGSELATSITIGIEDLDATIRDAIKYKNEKFAILKIKIGTDLKTDIIKLRKIREVVGENTKLIVDANQGYSLSEALELAKNIEELNIEFIEQPVPYWNIRALKTLREKSNIAIMADESIKDFYDLERLISTDSVDLINIKLMKVGGIKKAITLAKYSKFHGIDVMVGCMVETKLGITAGMHFSLTQSNVKYVDLDSHLELSENLVIGGVRTEAGKNIVTDAPGLGISFVNKVRF